MQEKMRDIELATARDLERQYGEQLAERDLERVKASQAQALPVKEDLMPMLQKRRKFVPSAAKARKNVVSERLIDAALQDECIKNAKYVKGIEPELFVPAQTKSHQKNDKH